MHTQPGLKKEKKGSKKLCDCTIENKGKAMIETALLFPGQIFRIGTDRRHRTEKWGKSRDATGHTKATADNRNSKVVFTQKLLLPPFADFTKFLLISRLRVANFLACKRYIKNPLRESFLTNNTYTRSSASPVLTWCREKPAASSETAQRQLFNKVHDTRPLQSAVLSRTI